jgi:TPR repeat protein
MNELKNVSLRSSQLSSKVNIGWILGEIVDTSQVEYKFEDLPRSEIFYSTLTAALANSGDALFSLGTMFEFGAVFLEDASLAKVLTIVSDSRTARAVFMLAEEKGHAEASFRLGLIAHHGIVDAADQDLAAVHFQKGAYNQHPTCCRMLGIYSTYAADETLARKWFLRGAELGDPICCFNTALEIEKGNFPGYTTKDSIVFAGRAADQLPEDDEIQNFFKRLSSMY